MTTLVLVTALTAAHAALTVAAPAGAAVVDRRTGLPMEPGIAAGPGGGALAWFVKGQVRAVSLDARGRPDSRVRVLQARRAHGGQPPVVAVDRDGNAVVAWRTRADVEFNDVVGACCPAVAGALLDARGRVRTRAPLSIRGQEVAGTPVAAIRDGRAVVGWGTASALSASTATLRRPFSVPVEALQASARAHAASVRADGTAQLVTQAFNAAGETDIVSVRLAPDGTPGDPRTLGVTSSLPRIWGAPDGTVLLLTPNRYARLAPPGRPLGPPRRMQSRHDAIGAASPGRGLIVATRSDRMAVAARIGTRGLRPRQDLVRISRTESPETLVVDGRTGALALSRYRDRPAGVRQGSRVVLFRLGGPTRSLVFDGPSARATALALDGRRALAARQTWKGLELRRLRLG